MSGVIISGQRRVPLQEVQDRAARAASGLEAMGVGEGDAVALLLRNDIAFFEASLAAGRLGAYAVPINWHNTAEELDYILRDSGARVLVAHADLIHPLRAGVPKETRALVVPTPDEIAAAYGLQAAQTRLREEDEAWADWLSGFPPLTREPPPQRASMIYTSGTTGAPKGVRRVPMTPQEQLNMQARLREVFGIEEGIRAVITGTLYHSAPNAFALAAARAGATIVLQPRFDAEGLLALISEHRLTHMHMVPIMFVRLLRLPEAVRRRYDLSSLRWVIHGAAPCPREVKEAMIGWWGPIIHEYYGSTEIGVNTMVTSDDWQARPGTVGRPISMVELRILDEQGGELPPHQPGQIYIRSTSWSDFTYHRQEQKRRDIERDGFLTVGDIGYLDDDGYLYLCDRKVDMVISGGVNIYPAEIEKVLIGIAGVRDCAVFGIPDEEYGEALMAVIQPGDGEPRNPEFIKTELRRHLAGYKVPRHIEFRDDLPREDSGKIFKRKLREPYWRDAGRSI